MGLNTAFYMLLYAMPCKGCMALPEVAIQAALQCSFESGEESHVAFLNMAS